jgi:hypothetical protein
VLRLVGAWEEWWLCRWVACVQCTSLCLGSQFGWVWSGDGVANTGGTSDFKNWVDFGDGICIELFREVSPLVFDKFSINSCKERSSPLMEMA